MKKLFLFLFFFIMLLLLASAITSCRSVKYVPVETVRHDSVYFNKVLKDSVYVKDSVLVVRGDTVTEYRYRYVYRYKDRTDTLYIAQNDTINIPYPVEKELKAWDRIKIGAWGFILAAILSVILFIILKIKK